MPVIRSAILAACSAGALACSQHSGGSPASTTDDTTPLPAVSGATADGRPMVVLAGAREPWNVAVDATRVFWASQGWGPTMAVPIAGGPAAKLDMSSYTVAIDDANVYTTSRGQIISCAKEGCSGGPTVLATGPDTAMGIAVDAANVYWVQQAPNPAIFKAPKQGGSPTVLAQTDGYEIAVDATNVYWAGSSIQKVAIDGGPVTTVADVPLAMNLTVYGGSVYFSTGPGDIWRASIDGSGATKLASGQQEYCTLAVDASGVYWTSQGNGTVMKAPVRGGPVTTLVSGLVSPTGIALDADNVYFTVLGPPTAINEPGDGAIVKIAK
jgi:hypothetical protein